MFSMVLKRRLDGILQDVIAPIRERREAVASDRGEVLAMLKTGTTKARERAASTLEQVRRALGLNYF